MRQVVMWDVSESCHIRCEWVMSHVLRVASPADHSTRTREFIHVTHMKCHMRMSQVTYECGISYANATCHIWMSHVTYEWVKSHMNAAFHMWMSHVKCEWVMSHMNESCHRGEEVEPHASMSHVAHVNTSCHMWMSHVACVKWSWRVYYVLPYSCG